MKHLEFTNEELSTFRELLEGDLKELQIQESRTDSHDFRMMLKRKEQILDKVLANLETADQPEVAEPVI